MRRRSGTANSMRECVAILDALTPPGGVEAAQRDAFAAMALAIDGRHEEALARGEGLRGGGSPRSLRRCAGASAIAWRRPTTTRAGRVMLRRSSTACWPRGTDRCASPRTARCASPRACLAIDAGQIEVGAGRARTARAVRRALLAPRRALRHRARCVPLRGGRARSGRSPLVRGDRARPGAARHGRGGVDRHAGPACCAGPQPAPTGQVDTGAARLGVRGNVRASRAPSSTSAKDISSPAEALAATTESPSNLEVQLAARNAPRLRAPARRATQAAAAREAERHRRGCARVRLWRPRRRSEAVSSATRSSSRASGKRSGTAHTSSPPWRRDALLEVRGRSALLPASRRPAGPLDGAALEALAQHTAAPDTTIPHPRHPGRARHDRRHRSRGARGAPGAPGQQYVALRCTSFGACAPSRLRAARSARVASRRARPRSCRRSPRPGPRS